MFRISEYQNVPSGYRIKAKRDTYGPGSGDLELFGDLASRRPRSGVD